MLSNTTILNNIKDTFKQLIYALMCDKIGISERIYVIGLFQVFNL